MSGHVNQKEQFMVPEKRTPMGRTRRCIVSRDPLPSSVFIAALKTGLSPYDEIEIIVDRRRGGPATDRPSIERRHDHRCAHALEQVGVAIVPMRATQLVEHKLPAASSIARLDPGDADEHELQRLRYGRRRKVRLSGWVYLTGLVGAILSLLVLVRPVETLMSRARPAAPPPSADRMDAPPAVTPVSQIAETPSPTPSSLTAPSTPPAAPIRHTPRAVDASASAPPRAERREQPRVVQDQAATLEPQGNDVDDPRAVIDWLRKR
jgi:hypothetical protein